MARLAPLRPEPERRAWNRNDFRRLPPMPPWISSEEQRARTRAILTGQAPVNERAAATEALRLRLMEDLVSLGLQYPVARYVLAKVPPKPEETEEEALARALRFYGNDQHKVRSGA